MIRAGVAFVLVIAMGSWLPPAHADLYSASSEYKKGDYAHALSDFLALAAIGQSRAQLNVAVMYLKGQGTDQSDIHAYAWAVLAAQNGEAEARKMADELRPQLAPGSERVAGWITAPYTPAALSESLLPIRAHATQEAAAEHRNWLKECQPVRLYKWVYPDEARREGMEGDVFVSYTLMPDGTARVPRVILDIPQGVFGAATRTSILNDGFARLPAGTPPVQCMSFYRFKIGSGTAEDEYPGLSIYVDKTRRNAEGGDPNSQLLYGMLLVGLPQLDKSSGAGLPWFLRAAQSGLAPAQFEVGYSLLMGTGCQRDEVKAVKWLRMAADQNEPNAEVTLAIGAMKGSPRFGDAAQAKRWLEQAVAQNNHDGELYLSALLAATPEATLRDPQRALGMLRKIFDRVEGDPSAFEIRAAAQAAEGDFPQAIKSEEKAIRTAHYLKWDVSPLEARLAAYRSGKPWYGDLLDF